MLRDKDTVTVEVSPAGEVAGRPVGEDLSGCWETSHGNVVVHDGALIQLQQRQIVSEEQKDFNWFTRWKQGRLFGFQTVSRKGIVSLISIAFQ